MKDMISHGHHLETKDGERCNLVVQGACHHWLLNSHSVVVYPCGSSAWVTMVALTFLASWNWNGRIWLVCQSVLDRFQLYVYGDQKINPASPHHDLWTGICRIVSSCGKDVVQLVISVHTSWHGETPAALRRVIVHNACIDRVARLAYQSRDEHFWAFCRKQSQILHQVGRELSRVVEHQLAVCKRWSEGSFRRPAHVQQREPRLGQVFTKVWENVTALLHMPWGFVTIVGQPFVMKLLEWWQQVFEVVGTPLSRVAFSQLYLLFQMQCEHPRVIKTCRYWLDPLDQPACLPERFTFTVWLWFRLTLQQFWKFAGFEVCTACTKPHSSMIICHVGVASIPISLGRFDILDDLLRVRLPGLIICQGEHLNRVPMAWV